MLTLPKGSLLQMPSSGSNFGSESRSSGGCRIRPHRKISTTALGRNECPRHHARKYFASV
jgi:hypothetical protein